jgi:hypothetical protein
VGRRAGTPNKMTAEVKEIVARCFEDIGGYEALVEWVKSSPARQGTFYTKMWMKLLPKNGRTEGQKEDHKDVVYKSVKEVRAAFADRGLSLEALIRLKQLEREEQLEEPEEGTKQIEAQAIDVTPEDNSRKR